MQDFGIVQAGYAVGSLLVVTIFGMLWRYRAAIVSIVFGNWKSSMTIARQQKAAREWAAQPRTMSSPAPVPPMVPQQVPVPSAGTGLIDIAATARSLTKDQYIDLGALLVDEKGKPVWSGKTLYKIAGGNYGEFLARMRCVRGGEPEPEDDEPEEQAAHTTPIVGRVTRAQFFETDPELAYQPPH